MNNEKKQIILNWLKQQEETDSLTQEQRDIFALIRESLHTKKYGLVFEEKEEDIVKETNDSILTLKQKDLIIANNNAKELNYLLEGDNYQALKLLQKTHRNRIDVIYIDPPYNTGNKDFIYNDAYVDSEDGFKHSKWLSFMKRRLELAKTLLSNQGVIFISIDDNEQAQLKLLCDEIFGENNFVADFIRKTKSTTNDIKTGANIQHENCLCYAKNKSVINLLGGEKDLTRYTNPDNDPNGPWISDNPSAKSGTEKNNYFAVVNPYTGKEDFPPKGMYWRFSISTINKHIKDGIIYFKKEHKENERGFIYKRYLNNLKSTKKTINSLDFTTNEYMNQVATKEAKTLDFVEDFQYPKPMVFIHKLLLHSTELNSIILDFFAGSGTTGHAVAKLNADDGGNRTYILCTNNENNICENVTFKRLSNIQDELPHNLIYQQIETINKDEFIVSNYDQRYLDQLEESSKQLSQLELGKLIDNKEIFFITSQDELENANEDDLLNATVIFMNENKVDPYRSKVYDHIKNKIIIIPDNYYEKELKETDYLW
ncbi:site-specific DNA-methyltransferase [Mycoplasma sp. 46852]|uniref:site-specific DNA-methyltransferase n=1 Tax=Mycoplasma sp. 46852 TaxID=3401683 RepID=UPI003AAB9569